MRGGLFLLESFRAVFLNAPIKNEVEYFETKENKVKLLLRKANLLEENLTNFVTFACRSLRNFL